MLGGWNGRGLTLNDRTSLDDTKVQQLLFHSLKNRLGVVCLSETHQKLAESRITVKDANKEECALSIIPNPEFVDGPSSKCALISVYAPMEANCTVEELDEFYLSLDEQVSSFLLNGLSPIIVGDFNLRLGQDSDPSPVTGPNMLGITASRNCSYLFSFCRNYTTTSNLRCSTRELSKDILRTPLNDGKTFIRDLKRKDQKSLVSFRWHLPRIPFCKFHRRSPSRLGIHCPYAYFHPELQADLQAKKHNLKRGVAAVKVTFSAIQMERF